MTTLPLSSLDTPPTPPGAVLSGWNFREVCPEILSPLTWSIVGSGMERGSRSLARQLGVAVTSDAPQFVAYLGFRPFHNVSRLRALVDRVPGVDECDLWDLLLGGPPPAASGARRRLQVGAALAGVPRVLRVLAAGNHAVGEAAAVVARAEGAVLAAEDAIAPWGAAAAFDQAVEAGRQAWALHLRTTAQAIVAAAVLRRALAHRVGEQSATELLHAVAHRALASPAGSAQPHRLVRDRERLATYEVADRSPLFATGNDALSGPSEATALSSGRGSAYPIGDERPFGQATRALAAGLDMALKERERSKALGLRALHCVRLLLDGGLLGVPIDEAALLGAHELRHAGRKEATCLVERRAAELERARTADVAVDVQHRHDRLVALTRTSGAPGDVVMGNALAPGWAEGELGAAGDGFADILFGERVEANEVLALRPLGVVTRYGSVLSHVAIVCRELDVPMVAGVPLEACIGGRRARVDGWTGAITFLD